MKIRNIAIHGGQTGDESKGKVIDTIIASFLEEFERTGQALPLHVIRFQAGNNAGHTLVIKRKDCPTAIADQVTLATHLFPSGVAFPDVQLNISRGVIIDFEQLAHENMDINYRLGIKAEERLWIDSSAIICLIYHRVLDFAQNMADSGRPVQETGTTGRGIGPAYLSEVDRTALHPYLFLGDKSRFRIAVERSLETMTRIIVGVYGIDTSSFQDILTEISRKERRAKKVLLEAHLLMGEQLDYTRFIDRTAFDQGRVAFSVDTIVDEYWAHGQKYRAKIVDMRQRLRYIQSQGGVLLFEGANGANLDKRWGIQTGRGSLTSSHTLLSEIPLSTGIQLEDIPERLLVFKIYGTKVGWHIYTTEIQPGEAAVGERDLTEVLKEVEFGATTGRQRMVGWFDLVEGRTYIHLNNPTGFVISKLDMLSGSDVVKVCTHYVDPENGITYTELPADPEVIRRCRPEYRVFPGWKEDIRACQTYEQLPEQVRVVVQFINAELQRVIPTAQLKYLSVTPARGLIEVREDNWEIKEKKITNKNILSQRYATPEINAIFSEEGKILAERELWIAVMKVQRQLGMIIPEEEIAKFERAKSNINLARIAEIEGVTRHDIKAKIQAFVEAAAAGEFLHQGLTSRDLTDNVEQMQIKKAGEIILRRYIAVAKGLAEKARVYASIELPSRTHNQPAELTLLGRRFAMWAEELYENILSFQSFLEQYPLRGIKGPVGTQASMLTLLGSEEKVQLLEQHVAEHLGFQRTLQATGQTYPRSLDASLVSHLVQLGSACSNFALGMRLMSGYELVTEGFKERQVGSSAMPHKMNTRTSERITGFMKLLRMYQEGAAQLSGDQWFEGDVSDSVVRRVIIPDVCYAIDGTSEATLTVLTEMGVYQKVISREVDRYLPFLATTQILAAAIDAGIGREEAHAKIKRYAVAEALRMREGEEQRLAYHLAYDQLFSSHDITEERINRILQEHGALVVNAYQQIEQVAAKIDVLCQRYPEAVMYQPRRIR